MTKKNPIESLEEIKSFMQRSTKFLSLSGWSGIWVGSCGLICGSIIYLLKEYAISQFTEFNVILIVLLTLFLAVSGGVYFTAQKAKKSGEKFFTHVSKRMIFNFTVPLAVGGLLCIAFINMDLFYLVAPSTIIFYGLALFVVNRDTIEEIKTLAILELILGVLAFYFFEYALFIWTIAFGLLHIIYGLIMWNKYDKKHKL